MSKRPHPHDTLAEQIGVSAVVLTALIRDHLKPEDFDGQKITPEGAEKLRRVVHGEPWQPATVLALHPNPRALRAQTAKKDGGGWMAVDVWGKNTRLVRKNKVIQIRMEGGRWVSRDF